MNTSHGKIDGSLSQISKCEDYCIQPRPKSSKKVAEVAQREVSKLIMSDYYPGKQEDNAQHSAANMSEGSVRAEHELLSF